MVSCKQALDAMSIEGGGIRIKRKGSGDYWVTHRSEYNYNRSGVSMVITFVDQSKKIFTSQDLLRNSKWTITRGDVKKGIKSLSIEMQFNE